MNEERAEQIFGVLCRLGRKHVKNEGKGHGCRNYSCSFIVFITVKGFGIYFDIALGLWQLVRIGGTQNINLIYSSTFKDEGETLGHMINLL